MSFYRDRNLQLGSYYCRSLRFYIELFSGNVFWARFNVALLMLGLMYSIATETPSALYNSLSLFPNHSFGVRIS